MTQETPSTESKSTPKSPIFAKTRKVFYYGLAIDSVAKSLKRASGLASSSSASIKSLARSSVKPAKFELAKSLDEIRHVHDSCASSMICTVIFCILFATFAFLNANNAYAFIVNGIITMAFVFYFACTLIVYLKCQSILIDAKCKGALK